jgi:hypothetical protein
MYRYILGNVPGVECARGMALPDEVSDGEADYIGCKYWKYSKHSGLDADTKIRCWMQIQRYGAGCKYKDTVLDANTKIRCWNRYGSGTAEYMLPRYSGPRLPPPRLNWCGCIGIKAESETGLVITWRESWAGC